MSKYNKITKEVIDQIALIPTLDAKKEFLLEYIGEIEVDLGTLNNDKKFKLAQFRKWVNACNSNVKFETMLWNSLLSGEGLSTFRND